MAFVHRFFAFWSLYSCSIWAPHPCSRQWKDKRYISQVWQFLEAFVETPLSITLKSQWPKQGRSHEHLYTWDAEYFPPSILPFEQSQDLVSKGEGQNRFWVMHLYICHNYLGCVYRKCLYFLFLFLSLNLRCKKVELIMLYCL